MKIEIVAKKVKDIKADCEVVFVVAKKTKHKWVKDLAELNKQGYEGGDDEVISLSQKNKIYVGITSLETEDVRIGAGIAIKSLRKTKYKSAKLGLYHNGNESDGVSAISEGFLLGSYIFDKYKSKPGKLSLAKINISTESYQGTSEQKIAELKKAVKEAEVIAEAVNFTRDIVNTPPMDLDPVTFSGIAKEVAKKGELSVKVYGENYIKKEGMGAFLAVSKASAFPPQLIHLTYRGTGAKQKIVLVGKGLTYDTGGLSIKPSEAMLSMKMDMGGAGAILGVIKAVSELKLPVEVHAIIGATENVIGKDAYKPDDVLVAKNGKTIEVRNTDAEGRLVLADILVYAQEQKPDYIIDVATLTGACVVALGEYTAGVMGHSDELKESMKQAAKKSGELVAELPFNRYLPKLMKSEIADISNISSGRYGGAITAAIFLSNFIDKSNQKKWLHIDIAGPAYVKNEWAYNSYGATGAGVRMITEWLKDLK